MEPRFRIVSGLLLFLFVLAGIVSAQVISVQILNVHTQQGISQKNISLLNVGTRATDRNGLLKINIPEGTNTIELQTPPGFEIVSPPGPIMPVPASENVIVKFWVKTALLENMQKEIDQLLKDKEGLTQQVKQMGIELEKLQQLNQNLETMSQGTQDSVALIKTKITEKDAIIDSLEKKVTDVDSRIGDYKLAIYSEITRNYQHFLNAILNMEMALADVRGAFVNEGELKHFNSKIEALNIARDDMHEKHLAYIEAAEKYWDTGISSQLQSMYHQAIIQTYQHLIIPLNQDLISQLKNAWSGRNSRIIAQKKAGKNLKKMRPKLRQEIEDLERIAQQVFEQLKSG